MVHGKMDMKKVYYELEEILELQRAVTNFDDLGKVENKVSELMEQIRYD